MNLIFFNFIFKLKYFRKSYVLNLIISIIFARAFIIVKHIEFLLKRDVLKI